MLTTVGQIKAFLVGVGEEVPPAHEARIEFEIQRQGADVETFCRRKFGTASYTEVHTGQIDQLYLYPHQWPITAITSVTLDGVAITEGIGSANYRQIKSADGEVVSLYRENGWASEPHGISVVYTAGYILPESALASADSGLITVSVNAAAKTFTRSTGSFVTDGFQAGNTVTFSGFTNAGNNGTKTIEAVTATVITVVAGAGLVNETGDGNERVTRVAISRTLPYDLEGAVVELAAGGYLHRGRAGVTRESFEGLSLDVDRWPMHILKTLRKYQRPVV